MMAVLAAALAAGVVGSRSETQQPRFIDPNPANMRIQYRPGACFPEGFPLHGKVRLLTAPVVEMGQRARVRIEYTIGDIPVGQGMAIEIWKHFNSDAEELQIRDPNAPGWFAADLTSPVKTKLVTFTNWVQRNTPDVFPYRKVAAVEIVDGRLESGSRVTFDLGGAAGMRMQHYAENLFNFRVALTKGGKPVAYAGDAVLQVTGGPMRALAIQAPSIVRTGETFPVEVVPQDEWGSLAKNSTGLAFRVTSRGAAGGDFRFDPELRHYVARDFKAAEEGVVRIALETADGAVKGLSNPIWVQRQPTRNVYFGDLHQHTYLADGRGVFEELYLYARRVAVLDFGAITPHHMQMSVTGPLLGVEDKPSPRDNWPSLMKATKLFNGWKGFISILGYEYSVGTEKGGHHNVFYNADEAKTSMQLDPKEPSAPVGKLVQTLQLTQKPTLIIPHIGGGPPDWSHPTDPRIERLFEIASVHGVFEEAYQKHLQSGQRLAASAAGDTHTVSMGNAYPGLVMPMTNGLTGVYAQGKSRNDVWNGLYERRTFAVTGHIRALMSFSVNGESMGGSVQRGASDAKIAARVSGTQPVLRVDLLKNSKVIHSIHPSRNRGRLLRVIWGDNVYQRRSAVGMTNGELTPEGGKVLLKQTVNLDQAFEEVWQDGSGIKWHTAAVSNDRDGFIADISGAEGGALSFHLDDSAYMGVFDVKIPLDQLKNDGYFAWSQRGDARVKNPYMAKMGVAPTFFLECELVDTGGPMDVDFDYVDRTPSKPGDYYYVRMEQLDANKAWSSPVWVN